MDGVLDITDDLNVYVEEDNNMDVICVHVSYPSYEYHSYPSYADLKVRHEIVAGKRIGQVMLIQVVPNQREENVVALQLLVGQQSNYTGHVYTTQQRKKKEGLN